MTTLINIGIVGACGRGRSFAAACAASGLRIHAVCDLNEAALEGVREQLGAAEKYVDYAEMITRADLAAVVIGTPMACHAPQARAALQRGLHVISEVTAGVSLEECRELVHCARAAKSVYMMAENCNYMLPNLLIRELVRRGRFGTTYYAEGEYLHELKGLNEVTRWRRQWQTGINGITYGTHSLGPILQWMPGDRVLKVCCAGSGHHYCDPRHAIYENEDSCVMLGQMRSGGLVKIRLDMLSDRPHCVNRYVLQGTDGAYESARGVPDSTDKVWLRCLSPTPHQWFCLKDLYAEYLPECWQQEVEHAGQHGHGGSDYLQVRDFARAIRGEIPCPIGIDEAMDLTLPGLVSQQSIQQGGAWLPVPDSRTWQ